MQIDVNNQVWIGFRDIGLGKYDGTGWVMFDSLNNGLLSNNVLCIDFAASGDLWIGTMLGASKYDGNSWTHFTTSNSGLPTDKIIAIHCDGSSVWFGTNTGLVNFNGANWTTYNTGNSGVLNDTISSVITQPNGVVWIGTQRGISKFENNTWTNYDASNSIIPSTIVYDLEFDNYGNIWISSNGVFVIKSGGQVLNFQGDIYMDEFPIGIGKVSFAKDILDRIYFLIFNPSAYLFQLDNLKYEVFHMPSFNAGSQVYGHCLVMNSQNILWYSSRQNSINSFITSFDFNAYQVDYFDFQPSFDNYKHLDINDVKALMLNRGDMHWDLSNAGYEVPKGSGKHSVFASALWIGGMDAGDDVHLAAQTYRQTGMDFWPGPISGISIPFDSASCGHYDKIWKINKWEVEAFKTNFLNGSVSNGTYPVPKFFLSWPAKGNSYVTDDKAPFVDFNNDNSYNPFDGDYPLIKGDQMLFWMFNDSLTTQSETGGSSIGIEVHASAYAYSCPGIADSNTVMNTTTLYNYRIINRSQLDYHDFYTGLWCDVDIGNNTDDYAGCDTTLATGFGYNGDNDDETAVGYGLNPPLQNIVILKGPLADPGDGVDNNLNGIVDEIGERTTMNHFMSVFGLNGSPIGNPTNDLEFYLYLQSIWLDSVHVTYGYNGRPPGTIPTNFMYSGIPYDTTGWTEFTAGVAPNDRRLILSSGPVSFPAGSELTIDFAYVYTRDSINPNGLTTSVARNIAEVQRVKSWFDSDNFPSCLVYSTGIDETQINLNKFLIIQPNPVTDIINFSHGFLPGKELKFSISDISGRVVKQGKLFDNSINFSDFENGIYLLKITDGNEFLTEKFLKIGN